MTCVLPVLQSRCVLLFRAERCCREKKTPGHKRNSILNQASLWPGRNSHQGRTPASPTTLGFVLQLALYHGLGKAMSSHSESMHICNCKVGVVLWLLINRPFHVFLSSMRVKRRDSSGWGVPDLHIGFPTA